MHFHQQFSRSRQIAQFGPALRFSGRECDAESTQAQMRCHRGSTGGRSLVNILHTRFVKSRPQVFNALLVRNVAETNTLLAQLFGALLSVLNILLDNAAHTLGLTESNQHTRFVEGENRLNVQQAGVLYLVGREATTFQ